MDATSLTSIIAGLGTVITVYFTLAKMKKAGMEERRQENRDVLERAREYADHKCNNTMNELENLEERLAQDIKHLDENYRKEIRAIDKKIDEVRNEIREHHAGLVNILTKMIEKD